MSTWVRSLVLWCWLCARAWAESPPVSPQEAARDAVAKSTIAAAAADATVRGAVAAEGTSAAARAAAQHAATLAEAAAAMVSQAGAVERATQARDAVAAAQQAAIQTQEAVASASEAATATKAKALAAQAAAEQTVTALNADADSGFDDVRLFGSANLIAGSLTGDDGGAFATGGVGVVASTLGGTTLTIAAAFGSAAISSDNVTAAQYAEFLLAPTSAVGLSSQVRRIYQVSRLGVSLGWSAGVKLNGHRFTYADTASQKIGLFSGDAAFTTLVKLSKKRQLDFIADVGVALRSWNKPATAFADSLGLASNPHVFYGLHVLAAFQIGNIYVGVEATKLDAFGDHKLAGLTDFAVLPYIGFRTGFGLEPVVESTDPKELRAAPPSARRIPSPTPTF